MAEIPQECRPPAEYLPDTIWTLPELQYPEKMNMAEMFLDRNVDRTPDKIAIYYNDDRISYRELQGMANRFANALRELGVEKQDRVLLRSPNTPEYLVWNFACWRIGAIPVLVNHLNRHDEVAFKANDSGAVAACVHADFYEDLAKARPECPSLKHVILLGPETPGTLNYLDLVERQSEKAETEDTSRYDYGRIIYSSGTTGKPKGILTTLAGLAAGAATHGGRVVKLRENDVVGGHPFFTFAFGSVNFTLNPWRAGCSVSIISRFRPEEQFRLVQEHRITQLMPCPPLFA